MMCNHVSTLTVVGLGNIMVLLGTTGYYWVLLGNTGTLSVANYEQSEQLGGDRGDQYSILWPLLHLGYIWGNNMTLHASWVGGTLVIYYTRINIAKP